MRHFSPSNRHTNIDGVKRRCGRPPLSSSSSSTTPWFYSVGILVAVGLCYGNSLWCGFVFDDISAIRDNRDLRSNTPISNLFKNDFWGTPMHKEQSHKSYRPLCVLTFRWNYALHELQPMGYHLVNVILHGAVCIIFYRLSCLFLAPQPSFVAALLFAVHPIHTEAVTGLVGRAELLSAIFFLVSFLCYVKATAKQHKTDWFHLSLTLVCATCAVLCKEQGITVIAICIVYEIFDVQKLRVNDILHVIEVTLSGKAGLPSWVREASRRITLLVAFTLFLLIFRLRLMGGHLPTFTRFDNPISVAPSPARQLTYNYLLSLNALLLFFPNDLCCDWTMGTVPLINSFADPRNLATVFFYGFLSKLVYLALFAHHRQARVIIMSLSVLVFPFLPASNLFFPVGFVIAERILYIPSMGFCMLMASGWNSLIKKSNHRRLAWIGLGVLLVMHVSKTLIRNLDWESEYTIFMAGLRVNQKNAKLFNNVGHSLERQGRFEEALQYFQKAITVQPDDIGGYINMGRTYNTLKMYAEAEMTFNKAMNLLPQPRSGESYFAKVAQNHLNVFLNLANLISRNESRLEEADALYRQAISMRADYTQAYINRGDVLIKLNRTNEAQEVYEKALEYDNNNPDIYYNLGVVFLEQGKISQALAYLNKALEFDPDHQEALMNSAILIQETGNLHLRKTAHERLMRLIKKGHTNEKIYFNLGMLAMDDKDFQNAEMWLRKAVQVKDNFRCALFNLALLLYDKQRPLEAAPFLHQLLKNYPDHINGLILLGDIYINSFRDFEAAEQCYLRILAIDPKNVQGLHNLCVVHVERGDLAKAETCFIKAVNLAPHEEYIQRHLKIVRNVMQQKYVDQPLYADYHKSIESGSALPYS